MSSSRQVSRLLDDQHRQLLATLAQVEQALAGASGPQAGHAALWRRLIAALEDDVQRHFAFEEEQLFTRLAEAGDTGIVELLTDEHHTLREVAAELLPLLRAAAQGPLAPAAWSDLKRLTFELIERQLAHIQKETMGLLPMLDDLLDEETDRELAMAHAA